MRHGVTNAEEGVCERHTRHARRMRHFFAGQRRGRAQGISVGQILENQPDRFLGYAVCKIGGHDGRDGLQRVGQRIDPRAGGKSLGNVHHQLRVDHRDVGHQLVIGERIFHARPFVRDNGKRRHLAARARGGGHRHKHRLVSHAGERIHSLADIHKPHGEILKIRFGVFVKHPHDLRRVHGRAAAQRDDHVGLKLFHQLRSRPRTGKRGIGRDVEKFHMRDVHRVEHLRHFLHHAAVVEVFVGDDKRPLFAVFLFTQLLEGEAETAAFEINFFGRTEPQHIFSPFRYGLDVDQLSHADVLRYAVPPARTAAERQRRRKAEIIEVSDPSLRRGRVDQHAVGLHPFPEPRKPVVLLAFVDIDRRRMPRPAFADKPVRFIEGVLKAFGLIHGENGRQLLVGKFLARFHGRHLPHQHLRILGHLEARKRGDGMRALSDDLRVQRAVDDNGLSHLLRLGRGQEIRAAKLHLLFEFRIDFLCHDYRLLGGADHTVIEGFRMKNGRDGQRNIGGSIHHRGCIARAHADRGLARGIRRLDHARSARRQNRVRLPHHRARKSHAGLVYPADDLVGSARLDGGLQHHFRRLDRAFFRAGMRGNNQPVPRLETDQRLKNRRGGGIGGRNDGREHADRLRDARIAEGLVPFDNAAGFGVLIFVVDIFGGIVIFDHLVLKHAHARLFHRHFCQRNARLIGRGRRRKENIIHLLLCIRGKLFLCRTHPTQHLFQRLFVVHDKILHNDLLFCPPSPRRRRIIFLCSIRPPEARATRKDPRFSK